MADSSTQSMVAPVMIAAGGTGGHVYPALAVAEVLRSRNIPVVWLGTKSGLEARVVPAAGFNIEWVNVAGIRGKNLLQTLMAPIKLLHSLVQAWRVFSRCKPVAVLGMGGFVAGPGAIVALLRRKPLIIHEQNSVAGMTNRWASLFAARVYTAFPDVFKSSVDAIEIGNPVRTEIEAIENPNSRMQRTGPCRLLVVGGSRGAHSLNTTVPQAAARCSAPISVWHQTGEADYQSTNEAYQAAQIDARVSPFIDQIVAAYSWADLIICRAGAMTVSELAAAGLGSILVPYPYAVDDHQRTNATWLVQAKAAVLLSNDELTVEKLSSTLEQLISDRDALLQMATNARGLHKSNAASTVADALQEVAL